MFGADMRKKHKLEIPHLSEVGMTKIREFLVLLLNSFQFQSVFSHGATIGCPNFNFSFQSILS